MLEGIFREKLMYLTPGGVSRPPRSDTSPSPSTSTQRRKLTLKLVTLLMSMMETFSTVAFITWTSPLSVALYVMASSSSRLNSPAVSSSASTPPGDENAACEGGGADDATFEAGGDNATFEDRAEGLMRNMYHETDLKSAVATAGSASTQVFSGTKASSNSGRSPHDTRMCRSREADALTAESSRRTTSPSDSLMSMKMCIANQAARVSTCRSHVCWFGFQTAHLTFSRPLKMPVHDLMVKRSDGVGGSKMMPLLPQRSSYWMPASAVSSEAATTSRSRWPFVTLSSMRANAVLMAVFR